MFRRKKRNVTLDSNVLISYVISKKDDSIVKKVVTKSVTDDRLMLTDVIFDECLRHTERRKARVSKEEMSGMLKELSSEIIKITPVPSNEELAERYKIRDKKDLKILYSVEMTDSVILVTYDDDFFDNVEGVKAEIMYPADYLREDERKGLLKKLFGRRRFGKIFISDIRSTDSISDKFRHRGDRRPPSEMFPSAKFRHRGDRRPSAEGCAFLWLWA